MQLHTRAKGHNGLDPYWWLYILIWKHILKHVIAYLSTKKILCTFNSEMCVTLLAIWLFVCDIKKWMKKVTHFVMFFDQPTLHWFPSLMVMALQKTYRMKVTLWPRWASQPKPNRGPPSPAGAGPSRGWGRSSKAESDRPPGVPRLDGCSPPGLQPTNRWASEGCLIWPWVAAPISGRPRISRVSWPSVAGL